MMTEDNWDTSDFLKRYASSSNHNGNTNHIQDEEMNSSGEDVFTPFNEGDAVFCTFKNLEERLLYLNQELSSLGFPSILDNTSSMKDKDLNGNFDVTKLVNCTYDLLRTHSRQARIKDDLEAGQTRVNNDNDVLLQTQDRLKHEIENLKNENALSQYREKELTKKCTCLQQDVKNERDEKRKMKSDIDQVRKQFYHESKRLEKEITRLKDKLNQTLSDKSNPTQKVLIDILNPLPRSDGKRSKWNVGTKKIREDEMYKVLIANYEEKEQLLVSENRDMRDTLNEVHRTLFQMDPSSEVYNGEGKQYQMPFHLVREDVNNKLQQLLEFLQKKVENINTKSKQSKTQEGCQEVNTTNTTNENNHEELLSQIVEYKTIISSQEKVLQGMKDGYNEETFKKLMKTFGTREDEIREFEDRKRLFQEDLRKYDQDRKDFSAYVAQVSKEKEEFDRERVEFYMHRISTPVINKELKMSPQKASVKSPTCKTPSSPNFVSAPCRSSGRKQKTPSTGELYKYLSLSYDSTSLNKKSPGYPVDGSYNEQNPSPLRRNSSRKVREHSDKIRKAVEDRQNKTGGAGDEKRNILTELENVK